MRTVDPQLTITVAKEIASYDRIADSLVDYKMPVTRNRKNGYLAYDKNDRSVGIVFMSDDERRGRFSASEIMFFNAYKKEYGIWRMISINGSYLPFSRLKELLQKNGKYEITTDERRRFRLS